MNIKTNYLIKSSIAAGIFIGLSAYLSLLINNQYISALAFSFGLLFISLLRMNLFTGKVGFATNLNDTITLLEMLIWNIIGIYFISIILRLTTNANIVFEKCVELSQLKLSENIFSYFTESILCGMLMFLAVMSFSIYKHYICIVLPVFVFITCGFEHSIANSFYYIFSNNFLNSMPYLFINIIGNAIGSLLLKYLLFNKDERKKKQ